MLEALRCDHPAPGPDPSPDGLHPELDLAVLLDGLQHPEADQSERDNVDLRTLVQPEAFPLAALRQLRASTGFRRSQRNSPRAQPTVHT